MRSRVKSLSVGALVIAAFVAGGGSASAAATKHLPDGFPVPAGTKLLSSVTSTIGGITFGTDYKMRVTSEKSAYAFWLRALPAAGYKLIPGQTYKSGADASQIGFTGHGLHTGTRINIDGHQADLNASTHGTS